MSVDVVVVLKLIDGFAAESEDNVKWGRCTRRAIPDSILDNLKKFKVDIVGHERPLGISRIQYGDEPWKMLKEWATHCNCEHTAVLVHHPSTEENSVHVVLKKGKGILSDCIQELRSLCKECSDMSQNKFNSEGHGADFQRSLFGLPGEYFFHGEFSWDTLISKLQSPGAQYPVLSSLPEKAYICDIIYNYADCGITVSVHKESRVTLEDSTPLRPDIKMSGSE